MTIIIKTPKLFLYCHVGRGPSSQKEAATIKLIEQIKALPKA